MKMFAARGSGSERCVFLLQSNWMERILCAGAKSSVVSYFDARTRASNNLDRQPKPPRNWKLSVRINEIRLHDAPRETEANP
jgi:hypothetical protein